jgi:acetylornithine deacetylase/succinyl-diaminopimelate desuccinylase-like protein
MHKDLLALAQARQPEVVSFLQDLVRLRSVNGRDTEAAVAQRVAAEAGRLNLEAQLVAAIPDRPNVLIHSGKGPRGFALLAHLDTVAEGDPAAWSSPPFNAHINGRKIIGRGCADNKAGLACGLYTLALIRDHGLLDPAAARLLLAGVVDEESGATSPLGVRYLLDKGFLPVHGAIYTYASDMICVGHRGLLRLQLQAQGQSIHAGSAAWSQGRGGVNAVTGLAAVLLALEQLHLPAPTHPAFAGLGCTITPGTLFAGGDFESIVPASATAMVDIRLMPGQSADEVLAAVQAVIDREAGQRPGLIIAMTVKNRLPGAAMAMDHPLAKISQHYAQVLTGRHWPVAGAAPANEGYMLIEAGIPTLCGFGPTGGNAHAPDEWIALDSLAPTIAMYAGIIRDYLNQ